MNKCRFWEVMKMSSHPDRRGGVAVRSVSQCRTRPVDSLPTEPHLHLLSRKSLCGDQVPIERSMNICHPDFIFNYIASH